MVRKGVACGWLFEEAVSKRLLEGGCRERCGWEESCGGEESGQERSRG